MPVRLVLVRHGLSQFNVERRIQGRDDLSELTEEGAAQAHSCGAALSDLPLTAAYCSPLQRARRTAELLLAARSAAPELIVDSDLLEIDLGPWSGLQRLDLRQLYPEQERRWREQPHNLELQHPDGRTYLPVLELLEQAGQFSRRLQQQHAAALDGASTDTVLVVAHNGILRCLLLELLALPASAFRGLRLDNASISVLNLSRVEGGQLAVQIESLNNTTHDDRLLPPPGPGPRLLLVRHGETDWNRQGRFQGQIDIPLNANGEAQAEAAGRFLADVPLQHAFTSPMARPRQTAERILLNHPAVALQTHEGLVEIGHGLWEGRLESEIEAGWPDLLAAWKRAPHTVQMPEGESIHDVWQRSLAAWNAIAAGLSGGETALVVAHDAVNKTILCALLGLGPEAIWSIKQGNGGVTVIDYPNGPAGHPVISSLNLTAHLGGVLDRTAAGAL